MKAQSSLDRNGGIAIGLSVYAIAGGHIKECGYLSVGGSATSSTMSWSGNPLYVTLAAAEDYLLWNIGSSLPSAAAQLYTAYAPLYTEDGNVYALMYTALKGSPSGTTSYYYYYNTYKDTLLTKAGINPRTLSPFDYGLRIDFLLRYEYPKMDLAERGIASNYTNVVTKTMEVQGETIYGYRNIANDEMRRVVTTGLPCRSS